MPSNITVVSPVCGETVYIASGAKVIATVDFDNAQSTAVWVTSNCTAPASGGSSSHPGQPKQVNSGPGNGLEVDLGPHNTSASGVVLAAQLQQTDTSGTIYSQASVNDVTIVVGSATPPTLTIVDRSPNPIPISLSSVRMDADDLTDVQRATFGTNSDGSPRAYDATYDAPVRDLKRPEGGEIVLKGTVADGYRDGSIQLSLSRRPKKKGAGLVLAYFVSAGVIPIRSDGSWEHIVTKQQVQALKLKFVRQGVVMLYDKNDVIVAVASVPMSET